MKNALIIFYFTLFNIYASGNSIHSNSVDTTNLVLNSKIRLLVLEETNVSLEYLNRYLKLDLKIIPIETKGFNNEMLFYKIHIEDITDSIPSESGKYYIYFSKIKFDFIFAYSKSLDKIFLLNGTLKNDFIEFFNILKMSKLYAEELFIKSEKFKNKFLISGLDLEGYFRYYINCENKFRSRISTSIYYF